MDIRVRSRDDSDVRDEFNIHDGFNSFVNDNEDNDSRESTGSGTSRLESSFSNTRVQQSRTPSTHRSSLLGEKRPKDPNEVAFDGPDDPEDPLNMPTWRKWVIVVVIATASTCV